MASAPHADKLMEAHSLYRRGAFAEAGDVCRQILEGLSTPRTDVLLLLGARPAGDRTPPRQAQWQNVRRAHRVHVPLHLWS